jgi:hypothetical protein
MGKQQLARGGWTAQRFVLWDRHSPFWPVDGVQSFFQAFAGGAPCPVIASELDCCQCTSVPVVLACQCASVPVCQCEL